MTKTVTLSKLNTQLNWSHYFAVYIWIGWLNFYIVLIFLLPVLFNLNRFLFSILLGFIIISALLPVNRELQPKIFYDFGNWLLSKGSEYFHVEEIQKHSPAIFALEPHDVLPISLSFFQPSGTIPGHECAGLITSVCFLIPIIRHVYTWSNAQSVDKNNIIKLIQNGISPALCPGGAQEVAYLNTDTKECVLYLSKRLGFIKIAYQYGVPIIPVFSFGLRNSFDLWNIRNAFLHKLGRRLGFLPVIFFGLWGTVMGPPKPCKYTNVIGPPILLTKTENPSEQELLAVSNTYINEIKRLFEQYKNEYDMSEFTLRVV